MHGNVRSCVSGLKTQSIKSHAALAVVKNFIIIAVVSLMDNNPHQIKCSNRHCRKLCGHCNEMLSYNAFWSHKIRFYNQSTQKWLTKTGKKLTKDEEPLARDDKALVHANDHGY